MIALLLVAGNAKHLTIAEFRLDAIAPRNNMVCVHVLEILFFTAHGTPMTLLLIHSHRRRLVELTPLHS